MIRSRNKRKLGVKSALIGTTLHPVMRIWEIVPELHDTGKTDGAVRLLIFRHQYDNPVHILKFKKFYSVVLGISICNS